jgi:hypothetical protein
MQDASPPAVDVAALFDTLDDESTGGYSAQEPKDGRRALSLALNRVLDQLERARKNPRHERTKEDEHPDHAHA